MTTELEQEIEAELPEEEAVEVPEADGETPAAAEEAEAVEDDEFVVSIGDEQQPETEEAGAPEWVKQLRRENREQRKRVRELEAKLSEGRAATPELGSKPRLEDCDFDEERFEAELVRWHERKASIDAEKARAEAEAMAQQAAYQERLQAYAKMKADLPVDDFEDAEASVVEALNLTQQGIIVQGADNPALVIYALGRNATRAAELSKISDPVKFAFAVAKLESQMKLTKKTKAPPPERVVVGSSAVSGSVDSQLERLRAEAERTGDYSKVSAYRRKLREKSD